MCELGDKRWTGKALPADWYNCRLDFTFTTFERFSDLSVNVNGLTEKNFHIFARQIAE